MTLVLDWLRQLLADRTLRRRVSRAKRKLRVIEALDIEPDLKSAERSLLEREVAKALEDYAHGQ